jgi:beta-lactamase superfamily II metal-dependent hydrolase
VNRWVARLTAALLTLAGFLTASAQPPPPGKAVIELLDVGQGDAILIRSPEGKAALVDAGPSRAVVDRLRETGLQSLDLVVVTHHHADHYGGMLEVIRQFPPRYFLATESRRSTGLYVRLLEAVAASDITPVYPWHDRPRTIHLGSVLLTVLPQPPEDLQEENENSIGLRVSYGDLHVLLTGDSQRRARRYWLQNCPDLIADCQILKLAHHGSHNGTDPLWLDVVRPRVAIVSLGAGNPYGHPHPQVLQLLAEYRIPLLRTDQRGTIRIETDGRRTDITGQRPAFTLASSSLPSRRNTQTRPLADGPRLNLNTASRRQLERILGLNPATSAAIIRNRPFRSLDELEDLDLFTPDQLTRIGSRTVVR